MTTKPVPAPVAPIRVVRLGSIAVLTMPLLLGAVVLTAAPYWEAPPAFLPIVLAAVAIGGVLIAETVGFQVPAIAPGTATADAARQGLGAYRSRWLVRAFATEIVLLVGVVLSFVLVSSWPYAVAFVLGWPIMVFEVWPSRRVLDKVTAGLEWNGAPSHLDDALHGRVQPSTA